MVLSAAQSALAKAGLNVSNAAPLTSRSATGVVSLPTAVAVPVGNGVRRRCSSYARATLVFQLQATRVGAGIVVEGGGVEACPSLSLPPQALSAASATTDEPMTLKL